MTAAVEPLTQEELDDIKIEDTLKVYMVWDEDGQAWEVDGTTMDGYALDSDGLYNTLDGKYDSLPPEKQAEHDVAVATPVNYIDLTRALNLGRAVYDESMQELLGKFSTELAGLDSTMKAVEEAADGDSNDEELAVRYEAIEALHAALEAAAALLLDAGIISDMHRKVPNLPFN